MFNFKIQLKDKSIYFQDIFDLLDEQKEIILKESFKKTFVEWNDLETGLKNPLENWQQTIVLAQKNNLIENKDEKVLMKERTIIFSKHAKRRIAVRIENIDPDNIPKPESLLLIIKLVIESNEVSKKGEILK